MRIRLSIIALNLILVLSLLLPVAGVRAASDPGPLVETSPSVEATQPKPAPVVERASERLTAVREGKWPAQVASSRGDIAPDRHGPQLNDPADGIPTHAYSPFDERVNREYPCPPGGCEFEPGQVLVKLAADQHVRKPLLQAQGALVADDELNQALAAQGVVALQPLFPTAKAPAPGEMILSAQGTLLPKPDLTLWHRGVLASKDADVYDTTESLAETEGVEWAEPNYLRKPVGSKSEVGGQRPEVRSQKSEVSSPQSPSFTDPLYSQQWHLSAVNADQAWAYLDGEGLPPGGARDIVVAVIDTGVDYTHPDLAANMWVNAAEFSGSPGVDDDGNGFVDDIHGVTVVSNQHSGDPQDDHGHGTHVAGIIAAQADNGIGGVGVAYNVQIMAIKAAQYSGVLSTSDIAEGIYYAVEKGADVINMSFGGYARSQLEEDALAVAFGQAVLVAAAGNDSKVNVPCPFGRDMYPAAYNWVLGVMARQPNPDTQGDYMAGFSNFDCSLQDSHEYELMAPGVDVWGTLPNEQYAAWDGTSMATPVISGIAALVRTKWADKDVYSSRFIMGQLATTGGQLQAYTPLVGPPVSYYVPDAYAALTTFPQPKLSYLEHWLFDTIEQHPDNDDDGIVDAGETIDLAIVIRNHWGKADNVQVTLAAEAGVAGPDPYVTMITDTVNYGAVGSFNIDDNGLIYENDVIVGVQHSFRFSVDPNTPNDHFIPFKLTMTAENGYDSADPNAPYTFTSNFYLLVQRGRELPRIISEDMVLTNDYYWLVLDRTLIETGVTVSLTHGTQVQFWSVAPNPPYQNHRPLLQNEGTLLIMGTSDEPVELFASPFYSGYPVEIRQVNEGYTELSHVRIRNPLIGSTDNNAKILNVVDHGHFTQELFDCIYGYNTFYEEWFCWSGEPIVRATTVRNSIFRGLGFKDMGHAVFSYLRVSDRTETNLFDSNFLRLETPTAEGNVFLKNYKVYEDESLYWTSRAENVGYSCSGCTPSTGRANNMLRNNAFLNLWRDMNIDHWMKFYAPATPDYSYYISDNFWGTTNTTLIDAAIQDYNDDFDKALYVYEPKLTTPPETAYPFVTDIIFSIAGDPDASIVGAEPVTFTVTFNRDMDTAIQPAVSFGPDVPETDYTIHPVDGGWADPRTWLGLVNITPVTGDGYQFMRIAGAVAADDPWLVTGDDSERFRFEIITSGTSAMNLQATGGEGYVNLAWTQDDFDLLAGFNLYRATSQEGTYTRINDGIIPSDQLAYQDIGIQPGQPYYYKFTIILTDMSESDFSNVAQATPIDTIAPVISHTPVAEAPPGLALTLLADVTDNVGVQEVTLYYRQIGDTTYSSKTMVNTSGDRYSATLEGSLVASPGLEYYIEAFDGISTVQDGRPENPHQVVVENRPVVTTITPNHGPASGGTAVTIAGSNFDTGASVTLGGAVCQSVVVVNVNQITCTTPPHFPAVVDVTVTNPDSQSGSLLNGFTYESETASLSLPDTGGRQNALVHVPINAANVDGLVAASLTVTFDNNLLHAVGADTGNLTPGWTLMSNASTPGELSLSLISPGGAVSGDGVLAYVEFDVVGTPGQSSVLDLTDVLLNDGAIPTETAAGSFTIDDVYDVSGAVTFWNTGASVPGAQLTLEGAHSYSTLSDATGAYAVGGAPADDYTLTPGKSDDAIGITAFDASQVLQHDVGSIMLTGYAAQAADVNKSLTINSMDAFYILQKAVELIGLPFPGAGAVWEFDPVQRNYTNLSSDISGQNFTAILLGDVSGSWSPPAVMQAFEPESAHNARDSVSAMQTAAELTLPQVTIAPNTQVGLDLKLRQNPGDIQSIDLVINYDTSVVEWLSATKGEGLAGDWSLMTNESPNGVIHLGLMGVTPPVGDMPLAKLTFKAIGEKGENAQVTFDQVLLNEQSAADNAIDGKIAIDTPPVLDLRGHVEGASLYLDWTNVGDDANHYEVWRAETPYFEPGTEGERIAAYVYPFNGTFYDDEGSALGNFAINHFYTILTIDANGRPSPSSNRFGEFDFSLVSGN